MLIDSQEPSDERTSINFDAMEEARDATHKPNPPIRATNITINMRRNTACKEPSVWRCDTVVISNCDWGRTEEVYRDLTARPQKGHSRKPHKPPKGHLFKKDHQQSTIIPGINWISAQTHRVCMFGLPCLIGVGAPRNVFMVTILSTLVFLDNWSSRSLLIYLRRARQTGSLHECEDK